MIRSDCHARPSAAALSCAVAAAPAQASMANPGLNEIAPAHVLVQVRPIPDATAAITGDISRHRYRHCWNHRVRVRVGHHHCVWRIVRRCDLALSLPVTPITRNAIYQGQRNSLPFSNS